MRKITFLLLCCIVSSAIHAQSWSINGNAAISSGINYLGTSDANDLVFRSNAIERGRLFATGRWRFGTATNYAQIDSTGKLTFGGTGVYQVGNNKFAFQLASNTNYGLFFNTTIGQYEFRDGTGVSVFSVAGTGNAILKGTLKIGAYTLPSTDGSNAQVLSTNGAGTVSWTALPASGANLSLSNLGITSINASLVPNSNNVRDIGTAAASWKDIYYSGSLYVNGIRILGNTKGNTYLGLNAGISNTFGYTNTFVGDTSGLNNTDGHDNAFFGRLSGYMNTHGYANVFLGNYAGAGNTTGNSNVMIGNDAGNSAITGSHNIFIGSTAGYNNTGGSDNTFVGDGSGVNSTGDANSFFGKGSGAVTTIGSQNTFLGTYSGTNNTSGSTNTATGYNALYANTTGNANTVSGVSALSANTTGSDNTAMGYSAMFANTTGIQNTAYGSTALYVNSTGQFNTAIGSSALFKNTTGFDNTALGASSLFNNTIGSSNTAVGVQTLLYNTTGSSNTSVGHNSMYSNTTGSDNTALGTNALSANTAGSTNTALGEYSLKFNTTGNYNTATGAYSLYVNTSGNYNTANGLSALNGNTAGIYNVANGAYALNYNDTGNYNTATGAGALLSNKANLNSADGYEALYLNTSGFANAASGAEALYYNTTGFENTAMGVNSLSKNTTGNYNTGLGYASGTNIATGSKNTFIGYNANTSSPGSVSNATALGAEANVTADNNFVFGNGSVVKWGFGKQTGSTNIIDFVNTTAKLTTGGVWTNASDKKLKNNFQKLDKKDVLNRIAKLDIQRWHYIKDSIDKTTHIGPVAQDFYEAFKVGDDTTISTIDPAGVALLGIQQLNANDEVKDAKIDALQKQVDDLKQMILSLQQSFSQCNPCAANISSKQTEQIVSLNNASLGQNIPNPFSNTTIINYSLPQTYSSAKIIITDKVGKTLKEINISGNGSGSIKVDASTMASSAYQYSLYVNNKLIDTKQMVIAR